MTEREELYAGKLSRMVQCETISEKGRRNKEKFDRFHEVLVSLFPNVFSRCEVVEIESSLLLRLPGKTKGEPFLFMSHQDVVPPEGNWFHGPFSGDIADGKVWGRGTVDTKGSLMCIFQAVEELIQEGFIPDVDLYIASSSTEEVFGPGAVKTAEYLKERGVHLQLLMDEGGMVVEDPMGGVKGRFAMIGTLEKGIANYRVTARSNGGHASTPAKDSPLARLGKFMADIDEHDPNKARMNPTVLEMFRRLGPHAKGAMGFILRHAGLFAPVLARLLPKMSAPGAAMIKTTMAFTMISGSKAFNVLPEEASLVINARLIHHQATRETTEMLQRYCDRYGLELEYIDGKEPQKPVDFTKRAFRIVEQTVHEIYPGVVPSPYVMTGGTDAYNYWPVTDDAIRFAPLAISEAQMRSVHGINENIDVASLPGGVDFYKSVARKVRASYGD